MAPGSELDIPRAVPVNLAARLKLTSSKDKTRRILLRRWNGRRRPRVKEPGPDFLCLLCLFRFPFL